MKTYLGDGAYAEFDGYALILTSEDGIRVLDRVVLEPEVWRNLEEFVESLNTPDVSPGTTKDNP